MKYIDEFRDKKSVEKIADKIRGLNVAAKLMEVCGTHTMAIFQHGIRSLLPEGVKLLSGPGCPVCVTPNKDIDLAIEIANRPDTIVTTFGDMMKVPGRRSSLSREKAGGKDIRIVYSPTDALNIAKENKNKNVVFLAVGFETTSPTIASTIKEAADSKVNNFFILNSLKKIPEAMMALLNMGEVEVDGFLCPGHVSVVIGSGPYEFIPRDFRIPCVISGFEPLDIMQSIYMLLKQISEKDPKVEIQYKRAVKPDGNLEALKVLLEVFESGDSTWRGLGKIPGSGLKLKPEYSQFDALKAFDIKADETIEKDDCFCGKILRGVKTPADCKLFSRSCTPDNPLGPCMVSSEGTCAAYYKYGRK
ncbi:MAG: hydrogenase formation protein HypD [Candidatus Saganbacteria bacterium]|nr:hydrogenase formation protein HypD [Candidatus Saganbacteria bacterium]